MKGKVKIFSLVVRCSKCGGQGFVSMTGVFADTMKMICQLSREESVPYFTAVGLAALAGCKPTAMSNRLAYLERRKFLTSEMYGVERRYKIDWDQLGKIHYSDNSFTKKGHK